jgi:hypothetical protein
MNYLELAKRALTDHRSAGDRAETDAANLVPWKKSSGTTRASNFGPATNAWRAPGHLQTDGMNPNTVDRPDASRGVGGTFVNQAARQRKSPLLDK